MKTTYERFEVAVAALGLAAAAAVAFASTARPSMGLPDVLRWAGVLLLVQGFFRDIVILARRRREPPGAEARRGWLICVESTLGLVLIALSGLLIWGGADRVVSLPLAGWTLLAAAWWAFGYAMREMVLELRRDPDHLNLLIGRPSRSPR
jgi:hypothetical protein